MDFPESNTGGADIYSRPQRAEGGKKMLVDIFVEQFNQILGFVKKVVREK